MKRLYKQYLEAIMMNDDKKVKNIIPVSAGVILKIGENGEKLLLLIQRAKDDHFPNHWEFPRGRCDKPMGESLIHCLKREVKEETGLDVTPIKEIDTFEYLADKGTRKSICHNFLCKLKNPNQKVKLSHEHQNFKWIQSVGEAEMLVLPDQKKSIDKAFNTDLQIVSYPENHFTKNNSVEEIKMIDNYLKELQEKDSHEEDDVIGVPVLKGRRKAKCKQLMIVYKKSVARYKKLGRYLDVIEKKYGPRSKQWERADEHYSNATQNSDDIGMEYERVCKKKAPYYG